MHPDHKEKEMIHKMWKKTFAFDDGGSIDDYFHNHFQSKYCFIKKKDNQIITTLCAHPHTMHLYEKQLPVTFISGVITTKAYRGHGYMKQLFHEMFQETKNHTALYVLQAYKPQIYQSLGFEMHYFEDVKQIENVQGIRFELKEIEDANAMAKVANIWLSQMEGWLDHDSIWFAQRRISAAAMGLKIYGISDNDTLKAFAFVDTHEETWYVEEYFAIDASWEDHLFTSLYAMHPSLLQRYATKDTTKKGCLMLALGNTDLLHKILNKEVTTTKTLLQDVTKTLYHVGYW